MMESSEGGPPRKKENKRKSETRKKKEKKGRKAKHRTFLSCDRNDKHKEQVKMHEPRL
jgi:hypothetical protein